MKISGISFKAPPRVVTNDEVLKLIERKTSRNIEKDLGNILEMVNRLFVHSGLEERRWLENEEPWFPYVKSAVEDALEEAGTDRSEVDCIIYSSVYRTVLDPSMACLIGKALGMNTASAFDVNEACASWARTVSIVQSYLKSGLYKKILVITNEAVGREDAYGNQRCYALKQFDDLEWAFPTYTMGSAATATLFVNEEENWDIQYGADNNLSDLCLYPMVWPKKHEHDLGNVSSEGKGPNSFACYGRKMQVLGMRNFVNFVARKRDLLRQSDIFFPHTQTKKGYFDLMKLLKEEANIYSMYTKFGNIVTNSLPASIADARDHGSLKRGDKVFMAIPASGLTMATFGFTY